MMGARMNDSNGLLIVTRIFAARKLLQNNSGARGSAKAQSRCRSLGGRIMCAIDERWTEQSRQ